MLQTSASRPSLLEVATRFAGKQAYPQGALFMVATPIGNLADISARALCVLELCDALACEDTRHTGTLLQAYGLHKPLIAVHEHNEKEAAAEVVARLCSGARIAYVSDAGTPALSDPGARLACQVRAAGYRVVPIPGASSVTALLSVAGVHAHAGAFTFVGFLPPRGGARVAAWQGVLRQTGERAVVLLESPHRIGALCAELQQYVPGQQVTIGREMTKQFEQIVTLRGAQCSAWLEAKAEHARGEFAVVLHPAGPMDRSRPGEGASAAGEEVAVQPARLLARLLQALPLKAAVAVAVDVTGLPRNGLYALGLDIKERRQS